MSSVSTKRESAPSRFLTDHADAFDHIPNVYSQISRRYFTRVSKRKESNGTHTDCN
jgi:hypothetical protein